MTLVGTVTEYVVWASVAPSTTIVFPDADTVAPPGIAGLTVTVLGSNVLGSRGFDSVITSGTDGSQGPPYPQSAPVTVSAAYVWPVKV